MEAIILHAIILAVDNFRQWLATRFWWGWMSFDFGGFVSYFAILTRRMLNLQLK